MKPCHAMIKVPLGGLLLGACFLLAGCSETRLASVGESPGGVEYQEARDVKEAIAQHGALVLVEIGVMSGCARCDAMRDDVDQLATEVAGAWQVRRVNFAYERAFVAELGVQICPTYVGFAGGREVFRASYPTSIDELAALMLAQTQAAAGPPAAAAVVSGCRRRS